MKMVNSIKDLTTLDCIFDYLESRNIRDYMLFFLGINTGLRISDLLKLKIYDVKGKDHIIIEEGKTGKERVVTILQHVKKELDKYLWLIRDQKYLFEPKHKQKSLSRKRAYQILKCIEYKFKLESLGTHTLRKTFGYHFYNATHDIATLMIIYNHAREHVTLRYIGVTQDRIDSQTKKWGGIKRKRLKILKHQGG